MARGHVTRKPENPTPAAAQHAIAETAAEPSPECVIRKHLRDDPKDPRVIAVYPCKAAKDDPDAWKLFEDALKAVHRAKRPVDGLLRQQDAAREFYVYRRD